MDHRGVSINYFHRKENKGKIFTDKNQNKDFQFSYNARFEIVENNERRLFAS